MKTLINVGVDVWDFYPVPEEDLCEIMDRGRASQADIRSS